MKDLGHAFCALPRSSIACEKSPRSNIHLYCSV
jgi:hypothetical protein